MEKSVVCGEYTLSGIFTQDFVISFDDFKISVDTNKVTFKNCVLGQEYNIFKVNEKFEINIIIDPQLLTINIGGFLIFENKRIQKIICDLENIVLENLQPRQPNKKLKMAIGYWGLIRGFKYPNVYESHKENLYKLLDKAGIEYDIYVATYDKDYDEEPFKHIQNVKEKFIDNDEKIQKEIKNNPLPFELPFSEESTFNLIKCWKSQDYLKQILQKKEREYDLFLTMDIAQCITSPLMDFTKLDLNTIYLSSFLKSGGLHVRFCLSNMRTTLFYLDKYTYLKQHPDCQKITPYILRVWNNKGTLHPEVFCKTMIGRFKLNQSPLPLARTRTNGFMGPDC